MAGAMFDLASNYHLVFSTCGVLVAAAIIMSVSLNRVKKTGEMG